MATALEPKQKLIAAYAYLCCDVPQHVIAAIMEVNQGRIAEAVQTARAAFDFPRKSGSEEA